VLALSTPASADQWNDRTVLTFSSPVMVPGATLPAGTYVFKLADLRSSRNIVQIFNEDGTRLITTTQAVPTKRLDASANPVLQFNPTDRGSPPAIKAWFYPNSTYGHEFVYSDEEARRIAERTKTVVLSGDIEDSDKTTGALHTYDAAGTRTEWRGDPETVREWDSWRNERAASSGTPRPQSSTLPANATAPLVRGDFQGRRVKLDELEDNASRYVGQTVSVDAEVQDVLGPRLFTIDEPNWGDLDGEMIVFLPTALAALVREDDRVTITGTVQPFAEVTVEREWGWFDLDPDTEVEVVSKPVLVASRVVGGTDNIALVVEQSRQGDARAGRSATTSSGAGALTDLAAIAMGDETLVGRHVNVTGAQVQQIAQTGGFFVGAGNDQLFVLPADGSGVAPRTGDVVAVEGVVLRMPDRMGAQLKASGPLNDDVYVYATRVSR
jgi:hypothetical protein